MSVSVVFDHTNVLTTDSYLLNGRQLVRVEFYFYPLHNITWKAMKLAVDCWFNSFLSIPRYISLVDLSFLLLKRALSFHSLWGTES